VACHPSFVLRSKGLLLLCTFTVDTEEEWDWSVGCPEGQGEVTNVLEGLEPFHSLCCQLGVKVTYFVNYSVLSHSSAGKLIVSLSKQPNAEIGFHIHPWNTPPFAEKSSNVPGSSFLHNLPEPLGAAKLKTVWEAFQTLGLKPTSFRGGRYSTCGWIQSFLSKRGVVADASILPFSTWADVGSPDYRYRNQFPQRIELEGKPLWEIPLSLGFTRGPDRFWSHIFDKASKGPVRWLRLIGIVEKLVCKRVWLNLENPLCDDLPGLLKVLRARKVPCINFTLHSSSLVVGKSPYVKTSEQLNRLKQRLLDCVQLMRQWPEFKPATVSEVAAHLEREFHESPGHQST
jgi:hypothetical protein